MTNANASKSDKDSPSTDNSTTITVSEQTKESITQLINLMSQSIATADCTDVNQLLNELINELTSGKVVDTDSTSNTTTTITTATTTTTTSILISGKPSEVANFVYFKLVIYRRK